MNIKPYEKSIFIVALSMILLVFVSFAQNSEIGRIPKKISFEPFVFPLDISKQELINREHAWDPNSPNPCALNHGFFCAVDLFADTGTPVLSPVNGTVGFTNNKKSKYGAQIEIIDSNGYLFYLGHLLPGTLEYETGDYIKAGAVIGQVGRDKDANNTPSHLHIDALEPGYTERPICAGLDCAQYPWIDLQYLLAKEFAELK